jgi:perosamine synthetase
MATNIVTESGPKQGFVPLCVPEIRGNEWKYVKECLDTGWVSSVGEYVERFERAVADFAGARFGVATVNGTSALHIALKVAGVQPDDEVVTSTLTFIAPANAVRYVGAYPVFIDAEPEYWQMDPGKAADFLERKCRWRDGALYNRKTGRRVKAILPVHILGHPVDMDPLLALARKYNLPVIEDSTEGLGAKYRGEMVGNLADISCFSFNGNKLITTGGGGMIVTGNEEWARKAKYLTTQAKDDVIEYIHHEVGYNYRLTNLLAAMGCAQMEALPEFIELKRRTAAQYTEALRGVPGITPMQEAPWANSTFWMFTVLVDRELFGMDSRALLQSLHQAKCQTRPLWQPLHRSQAFADCEAFDCPVADRLNRDALSVPCSVGLAEEDLRYVAGTMAALAGGGERAAAAR